MFEIMYEYNEVLPYELIRALHDRVQEYLSEYHAMLPLDFYYAKEDGQYYYTEFPFRISETKANTFCINFYYWIEDLGCLKDVVLEFSFTAKETTFNPNNRLDYHLSIGEHFSDCEENEEFNNDIQPFLEEAFRLIKIEQVVNSKSDDDGE